MGDKFKANIDDNVRNTLKGSEYIGYLILGEVFRKISEYEAAGIMFEKYAESTFFSEKAKSGGAVDYPYIAYAGKVRKPDFYSSNCNIKDVINYVRQVIKIGLGGK